MGPPSVRCDRFTVGRGLFPRGPFGFVSLGRGERGELYNRSWEGLRPAVRVTTSRAVPTSYPQAPQILSAFTKMSSAVCSASKSAMILISPHVPCCWITST